MIKCHWCKKELEVDSFSVEINQPQKLECPEGHATVEIDEDDKIISYALYWDFDLEGEERFKLMGFSAEGTYLYYSSTKTSWRRYRLIFKTGSFIEIPIRDNILQLDNLIQRLQKLGAFS